jgi:hypothetical protein
LAADRVFRLAPAFFAAERPLAAAAFRAFPFGVLAPEVLRPVFFAPFRAGRAPLLSAARRPVPAFLRDGVALPLPRFGCCFDLFDFAISSRSFRLDDVPVSDR